MDTPPRTTADAMIKKNQEEYAQVRFKHMSDHFFRKWQPEDPREAQEFSAELFMLVRQIQCDSMKPLLDHITTLSRLSIMTPNAAKLTPK